MNKNRSGKTSDLWWNFLKSEKGKLKKKTGKILKKIRKKVGRENMWKIKLKKDKEKNKEN